MKKNNSSQLAKYHVFFWGSFILAITAEGWANALIGIFARV